MRTQENKNTGKSGKGKSENRKIKEQENQNTGH